MEYIASKGITNNSAIIIVEIINGIEEKIKWRYVLADKISRLNTSIIRTNKEGLPYFGTMFGKQYLDDYLKRI